MIETIKQHPNRYHSFLTKYFISLDCLHFVQQNDNLKRLDTSLFIKLTETIIVMKHIFKHFKTKKFSLFFKFQLYT